MDTRTIRKLMAWVVRCDPSIKMNTTLFFAAASIWKYGTVNKWQIDQCVLAFEDRGHIPKFVREFIRDFAYPLLLKEGGKEKLVLIHKIL